MDCRVVGGRALDHLIKPLADALYPFHLARALRLESVTALPDTLLDRLEAITPQADIFIDQPFHPEANLAVCVNSGVHTMNGWTTTLTLLCRHTGTWRTLGTCVFIGRPGVHRHLAYWPILARCSLTRFYPAEVPPRIFQDEPAQVDTAAGPFTVWTAADCEDEQLEEFLTQLTGDDVDRRRRCMDAADLFVPIFAIPHTVALVPQPLTDPAIAAGLMTVLAYRGFTVARVVAEHDGLTVRRTRPHSPRVPERHRTNGGSPSKRHQSHPRLGLTQFPLKRRSTMVRSIEDGDAGSTGSPMLDALYGRLGLSRDELAGDLPIPVVQRTLLGAVARLIDELQLELAPPSPVVEDARWVVHTTDNRVILNLVRRMGIIELSATLSHIGLAGRHRNRPELVAHQFHVHNGLLMRRSQVVWMVGDPVDSLEQALRESALGVR